jgi:lipoprotein signal peptidase
MVTVVLKTWIPRLVLGLELAFCAYVALHLDAGVKTRMKDGAPWGECSTQQFEWVGLAWIGMVVAAFIGAAFSMFGRAKWIGLLVFAVPVIVVTTAAKYQEDHNPPCWERPVPGDQAPAQQ